MPVGINISKSLRERLPEPERNGIADFLWDKSGGLCHLCGAPMNRASDSLEADHDVPESEGGATNRANLCLAHSTCNRAKGKYSSAEIRPYLRLKSFIQSRGGVVKYDDCAQHFEISQGTSNLTLNADQAKFEFADGSIRTVPLFSERRGGKDVRYVFVDAPRCAIFNDADCQPRVIKEAHAWAIFQDLRLNPLHEPPSCRILTSGDGLRLAMFDGQHKAIATWMRGDQRVAIKVYLDMTKDEAIRLVNSIQAKIKKLPLSPFELAAKMSDEWSAKLRVYEAQVDPAQASEQGFIDWLESADRTRGTQAFKMALVQDLLDLGPTDLPILEYVELTGRPRTSKSLIKEAAFKGKVLERMIQTKPLSNSGPAGQACRANEKQNITTVLNLVHELIFEPEPEGGEMSPQQIERRRRFAYQSSLAYCSSLLRAIYRQTFATEPDRAFLDRAPKPEELVLIRNAVTRLANHPVWTAEFDTQKMQAVKAALQTNQDAKQAFEAVHLKLGYLVGADDLPTNWNN